ncbi:MAG: hypothetical protein L3J52_10745 [Proteobacteria bacterium]|nr:hypothetical protein [Pseudomonadota bacterium]
MSTKIRRPIYKIRRDNLLHHYNNWSGVEGKKNWRVFAKFAEVDRTKLSSIITNSGEIIIGDDYAKRFEVAFGLAFGSFDMPLAIDDYEVSLNPKLVAKIHTSLILLLDEMRLRIDHDEFGKLVSICYESCRGTGSVSTKALRRIIEANTSVVL